MLLVYSHVAFVFIGRARKDALKVWRGDGGLRNSYLGNFPCLKTTTPALVLIMINCRAAKSSDDRIESKENNPSVTQL